MKIQAGRWSAGHAAHVLHRLQVYVFADIGHRPIADMTPLELLDVIRRIEARGATEVAHRVAQTCGQVFRYGIVTGRCTRDVAADLRSGLVKKHMRAIQQGELPELLSAIEGYKGDPVTRLGFQFLALTFVRTIELIRAEWQEFDQRGGVWVIPASTPVWRVDTA